MALLAVFEQNFPAGAKAHFIPSYLLARLKSCPDTKQQSRFELRRDAPHKLLCSMEVQVVWCVT
jgi:hypothetical protein